MNRFAIRSIILILIFSFLSIQCNISSGDLETKKEDEVFFGVEISLPESKSDLSKVSVYSLSISNKDQNVVVDTKNAMPKQSVRLRIMEVGTYEVVVSGRNSGGLEIAYGKITYSVTEKKDGFRKIEVPLKVVIPPSSSTKSDVLLKCQWFESDFKYGKKDAESYDFLLYSSKDEKSPIKASSLYDVSSEKALNDFLKFTVDRNNRYYILVNAKNAVGKIVGEGRVDFAIGEETASRELSVLVVGLDRQTAESFDLRISGIWDTMDDLRYGEDDAVSYNLDFYFEDGYYMKYENIAPENIIKSKYNLKASSLGQYKFVITALDYNKNVVGQGETSIVLRKTDEIKNVIIQVESKERLGFYLDVSWLDAGDGYYTVQSCKTYNIQISTSAGELKRFNDVPQDIVATHKFRMNLSELNKYIVSVSAYDEAKLLGNGSSSVFLSKGDSYKKCHVDIAPAAK